jgi:hypothetical protein
MTDDELRALLRVARRMGTELSYGQRCEIADACVRLLADLEAERAKVARLREAAEQMLAARYDDDRYFARGALRDALEETK